jgi:hypothetical protein
VSAGEAHQWWRMAHFDPKIDDGRRTPVDDDASGGCPCSTEERQGRRDASKIRDRVAVEGAH